MDKVIVFSILAIAVYLVFRFKPPILINSVEAVVLLVRDFGLALTYPKYFHNDPKNYKVMPFETIVRGMKGNVEKNNNSWTLMTDYNGEKRPTSILLLTKFDPQKPSIIYHHGAGSTHPLKDFDIIFGKEFKEKFNVFVVWAQYHTSKNEYLEKSVDSFLHHQETFAGSVLAYQEIVKYHKSQTKLPIVATGSSMGGIVSSLHAFYFGSADYYFPLVAYPNVGEIFLGNAYRYAVADIENKRENQSYVESFAIREFDQSLTTKVFPIIGGEDKVVPTDNALQFWESRGFAVAKFPYGHFTPGMVQNEIKKVIFNKIGM